MIDKTKNHIYIITINYYVINEKKQLIGQRKTFTSVYSITSKKFRNWLDEKIKEIPNFAFLDEEYGTQYTVPLSDFCK